MRAVRRFLRGHGPGHAERRPADRCGPVPAGVTCVTRDVAYATGGVWRIRDAVF
ncbi:hypothetical protein I118_1195 [Bifidobacterium longum D2957]|nr:hypothetical protein I118_1195 [Bifidobacterium longum D2957]